MVFSEEVANMVDPRGASSSRRAHLPFLAAGFDPYGRPVFGPSTGVPPPPKTPQFNPHDFWPPPPSSTYSQNLVQAWEVNSLISFILCRKLTYYAFVIA